MTVPRRRLEANEQNWWAQWAKLEWIGDAAYLLSSKEFTEIFFNRGMLIGCPPAASIGKLERRFRDMGLTPALMVQDSCSGVVRRLVHTGYQKIDVMTVMSAGGPKTPREGPEAIIGEARSKGEWAAAYLMAFYGDLEFMPAVSRAVGHLRKGKSTLLEAAVSGEVAGVLAMHRTPGLAGVYCVGTVPEFRNRGIAAALLARAGRIASAEGRTLFLQTLETDGTDGFYVRQGFTPLYRKLLMQKKS